MKRDDVAVEVREGMLVVSGSKNKEAKRGGQGEGESVQASRRFGRFSQAMTLPDDAKRDEISAEFADGVLHVSIPRDPEHGKDRTLRIEVRESSGSGDERGSNGSGESNGTASSDAGSRGVSQDARQKAGEVQGSAEDDEPDARKDGKRDGKQDASSKDGK